ncbi:retrotransposon protein, putative, unclassified [Panicum miliaceum]|uniref:Retrotransposon protein, putative, unclassified n=1 Tax=Panicum miliaceum TaxID=4540 RepID=A0A3L6PTC4_PANMI|nr:retrotransposon protein, putative, unclassified [Panicum miliaceum]
MSHWRPSTIEEAQLEDFAVKGLLPPRAVAHWRAPPMKHEQPQPKAGEIAFFYGWALLAKGDPELAPVGGFSLQKRARRPGDYPAYTPADSNRGWHEEWFYIRNLAGNPFPSFMGEGELDMGSPTPEKPHMRVLETVLRKRVVEEGLDDPNRVSPVVVSNEEVGSWLDMVLKVGNQQIVGGPQAFDTEHPPDLVLVGGY